MPRQTIGSNWPFVPDPSDPGFDPIEDGLNHAGSTMRIGPTARRDPFAPPFIRTPLDPEEILIPQGSAFAWDNVRMRLEQQAGNVQPPAAPDLQDDGTEKIGAASPIAGGMGQSNDLQSFAARTAALNEARKKDAPYVRTFPRGNGRLGAATVAKGQTVNGGTVNPLWAPCVRWATQDPEGTDPQPISILLSAMLAAGAPGNGIMRPFAWIKFGTQAGLQNLYVDAAPGCQFTIAASFVDIQVGQAPVDVGHARLGTAGDALVTAMLSFGPIAKARPVHYTTYGDSGTSGLVGALNVPPMAESCYLLRTNPNANAITIDFTDNGGNDCGSVTVPAGQSQTQPIEVPPDATAYTITTTDAAASWRVIWNLGL